VEPFERRVALAMGARVRRSIRRKIRHTSGPTTPVAIAANADVMELERQRGARHA